MIKVYSASYADVEKKWALYIGSIFTVVNCCAKKPGIDSYALKIKYPIVPDKALYAKFKKGKIDYTEFRREYEEYLSSAVNPQSLYDELHRLAYENGTDTVILLDDEEDEEMSVRVIVGSYLGKAYCGELQ